MSNDKTVKHLEHCKQAAILCHQQQAMLSCPFAVGDHSRPDLYYCGQLFTNPGDLYKHLLESHTEAEVEALFNETKYDKKADAMARFKIGRGHKPKEEDKCPEP